jgi:hypothetical protein
MVQVILCLPEKGVRNTKFGLVEDFVREFRRVAHRWSQIVKWNCQIESQMRSSITNPRTLTQCRFR